MLGRGDFRIIHVSIQSNHVHLIVEADDRTALARGVQAFEIVAARRLNAELGRPRGRVFVHRYHATAITTPRQARHCLAYVLNNWRRHREDLRGVAQRRAHIDPYSSAIRFDGWLGVPGTFAIPAGYDPLPTSAPTVWLLTTGWVRTKCGSCVRATGQDGWFDPFVCRWCGGAERSRSATSASSISGQAGS